MDKVIEERLEVLQSLSSLKWRLGFSLLALSVGAFFGITAVMYPRRMVNGLVFNKQTNTLSISTHNPIGGIHQSQVRTYMCCLDSIVLWVISGSQKLIYIGFY